MLARNRLKALSPEPRVQRPLVNSESRCQPNQGSPGKTSRQEYDDGSAEEVRCCAFRRHPVHYFYLEKPDIVPGVFTFGNAANTPVWGYRTTLSVQWAPT